MYWETKNLCDSLYYNDLEMNPQYLWGMSIKCKSLWENYRGYSGDESDACRSERWGQSETEITNQESVKYAEESVEMICVQCHSQNTGGHTVSS